MTTSGGCVVLAAVLGLVALEVAGWSLRTLAVLAGYGLAVWYVGPALHAREHRRRLQPGRPWADQSHTVRTVRQAPPQRKESNNG